MQKPFQNARRLAAATLCLGMLTMVSSGCVTTKPWERGFLARSCMAPDPHPIYGALRSHFLGVREGSVGGLGHGGGGCGCN